jgi:RNA polymerase sigma-70 factor (ECF subfamily)
MPFGRIEEGATSAAESEWRREGALLGFIRGSDSLKEKVARHFEQWREPVYRYLVAAFGPAAQAEEITQEVFLKLYEAMQKGQEITNVRAWVLRSAHNLAIDQIRTRQYLAPLDEAAWEAACRSLQDTTPNPEQRLLQLEKFGRLQAAVARLTRVERQCLHLRVSGLRYREIGEIVSLSTTSVAETLYRVIQKLAQETQK